MSMPSDQRQCGTAHLLGGLGVVGDVDDDDRVQAERLGDLFGQTVGFTGIGFDGDGHDSGVDGFLEEAGDLESAESVRLADLDLRPTLEVVIAGQLRQEASVAGGGHRGHCPPFGVDVFVFAHM